MSHTSSFSQTERAYGGRVAWQHETDTGRTQLNYDQWVVARMPEFKAEFGDWQSLREIAAMRQTLVDWTSNAASDIEWAKGKTVPECEKHFGKELKPIAYVPEDVLQHFTGSAVDNRVYSSKGYFIEHMANHGHNDLGADEYRALQEIFDSPDEVIKDTRAKKGGEVKDALIFVKRYAKNRLAIVELSEKDGQIIFHKSLYNTKGRVYPSLPRVVVPGGGRSPISRTADAAPGGSLSVLDDNKVNVINFVRTVKPEDVSAAINSTTGEPLAEAIDGFRDRRQWNDIRLKLSKDEQAAQRSFDFGDKPNYGGHTAATLQERKERNEPAPEEPALEAVPRGADHIAARVLNWALARKFDNPDWRNAYTAAPLPEGMAALQADFEAAFGRTIHPVMPTADRFNSFGGVYLTDQPGKVFVNVRRAHEVGFLQLAGHELLHDLKRDREDLYHWFVAQADQYLTNVEDYRQRLNILSEENGIAAHSLQSAKEELIADFTGDALADTQFLGQLAESDRQNKDGKHRFTAFMQTVDAWFSKLGDRLRGRGMESAQHVKDVDGLRKHLSEVLIAYVNKQDIRQLPSYQAQAKERAAAFEVMLHHDRRTNDLIAHKKGDGLKRPLKRWTVPEDTAAGKYATEVVFPWIRENRAELVAAWEGAKFSQQPNEPEPLVSKAQPDEECARILQGEAVASVSKRDAVQAAHKGALAKELKKLFAEKFEGQAVRAGLGTVLLDDQAAEDSAAHSDVRNEYKMATFAAAKDVIEQGGVIAHALHGGIHSYYIAAPVLVDGVRHVMTAHVRRTKEQRLYLHSIRLEANLLQQETKENLSTQGESWAAAVGYATGDTGSQAPRGSHNLPEGIHAGKLQHSELTARLRHLLTLDVQQTQDDNDIKLSLTRSPEREAAIDALLPAMSADEMVMYPLSETWPETLIDGVEDDEQAAVLHVLRTELARREPPMAHGADRHEWAQRAANTREYARRVMRWSPKDARDDLRDGLRGYSADHMEFLGQFPREYWPRIDAAHRTHAGISMSADGKEYHIWTKDFRIASARLRAIMDGDIVEARNVGEENHMERSKEFYKQVADKLIAQLESGTAPWQKPWDSAAASGLLPMNFTTGKRYRGINAVNLMMAGHSDPRWMTYKQAQGIGAQVRRGEKGTPIQHWKYTYERDKLDDDGQPVLDENGKPVKETVRLSRPQVFFSTVFHASQIDGLPPLQAKEITWNPSERASAILTASGAKIEHSPSDQAFYRPSTDTITLPLPEQFHDAAGYYATALHELGHWTGHESRLGRDIRNPFGSVEYAKEELRAEISSMILGDELGIGHDPAQHAAYVGHWIKILKDDPSELYRAASDAEEIFHYVLALEQQQEQTQEQAQAQEQVAQPVEQEQAQVQTQAPQQQPEQAEQAEQNQTQEQTNMAARKTDVKAERIWLDVPWTDKDEAKRLGAKWDGQEKAWYVPAGVDPKPFEKWLDVARIEAADEQQQAQAQPPELTDEETALVEELRAARANPDAPKEHIVAGDVMPIVTTQGLSTEGAHGVRLPLDWNGEVYVEGVVLGRDPDEQWLKENGMWEEPKPDAWGIAVGRTNGERVHLMTDDEDVVEALAARLRIVAEAVQQP
ncbi:MAG: DUF1738 domain-containing protein, partial [Rhodocyclaceae bacterium]|nr:DUF1738 domain-containing protein [Rhodocyclaceae bacterium]